MNDQNKKTLRQFQCRDYLWEIFEQMSGELECSVDYLINEAMRQYARSRNYGARTSPPDPGGQRPMHEIPGQPAMQSAPPPRPPGPSYAQHSPAPLVGSSSRPVLPQTSPQYGYPSASASVPTQPESYSAPNPYAAPPGPPPLSQRPARGGYPAPPSPGYPAPPVHPNAPSLSSFPPAETTRPPALHGAQPSFASAPAVSPNASAPPPLPGGSAPHVSPVALPTLYVIFNGQKFPVNKEEFIIGRGTKTADLAIKDGNISRRHAAIIHQNGGFYMKDLGSTNGIEFQGRRVDGRRIEEGDVYQLCDYELRFTYR